jgi:Holliday junction DNA helicase RuvA
MFNSLYGTITAKFPRTICLETGGVEWELFAPSPDSFPPVGEKARIYTWLYHREDSMALFGFPPGDDRLLVFDLLKVDGIGAKAAVKILSSISSEQLRAAIDNEELARLEAVPGLGKKTAQKMMLALRGKLTFADGEKRGALPPSPWQDIISALSGMGYDRRDAEQVIDRLAGGLAADAEFAAKTREAKEAALLTRAIVELAR